MTLKRVAYVGGSIVLVLFAASVLFLGNQRIASADSFAEDINCDIYERLVASGAPISEALAAACGGDDSDSSGDSGAPSNPPVNPPVNPCDDIFPSIPGMPECEGDADDDEDVVDACPNEETDAGVQESGPCSGDDVCPDDDGIQTSTPCQSDDEGGNEETPPASGGGGGGGGGIVGGGSYPRGQVLGAATGGGANSCEYITGFIKPGETNDIEQVYRLQAFLKVFEGAGVEMNGVYDEASIAAVHTFQSKYAADILAPWGENRSTGYVYLTTRKKINEIYCDHSVEFALSNEEQQVIEESKMGAAAYTAPVTHATELEQGHEEPTESEEEIGGTAPVVDTPSRSVWGFIRGLFDLFR